MAQSGEKVWFRKLGEDGGSTYASSMMEGRFVGYHSRTGAVLCLTADGLKRGKSWTRQSLNDAWDITGFDKFWIWSHDLTIEVADSGPVIGYVTIHRYSQADFMCHEFLHLC